jgi:hypothetical protein
VSRRKIDGKLANVLKALKELLDQEPAPTDQVKLKYRGALTYAGGPRALERLLGEGYWTRMQRILHDRQPASTTA